MKQVKIITTFSYVGYQLYGKIWIDTFMRNVHDDNVLVDIYVDFPLSVFDSRIRVIDYNSNIPDHKQWMEDVEQHYTGAHYNKKMAKRFSYKAFVMQHALANNVEGYLIWLDGDCEFKSEQDFSNFPMSIMADNFIAVQREQNGGDDHCESGFVAFDLDHPDKIAFTKQFIDNYRIQNILKMDAPYDGFIIYRSLDGIKYTDLNNGYGRDGIQSDPNETFLHPEINIRFVHNIGITGKTNYTHWQTCAKKDEYFQLINRKTIKTPEEVTKIREKLWKTKQSLHA